MLNHTSTIASVGVHSKEREQMDMNQSIESILVRSKALQGASPVRSTTKQEVVSCKHINRSGKLLPTKHHKTQDAAANPTMQFESKIKLRSSVTPSIPFLFK